MGISVRRLFVTNDGVLYRMSNAKLERMMQHPEGELVPRFAGQRVRSALLMVELVNRKPYRVLRETFSIFQFDGEGRLDVGIYDKQQIALVNIMLDPIFGKTEPRMNVHDATDKFVAKGGSWSPDFLLKARIQKAALGQMACPSL